MSPKHVELYAIINIMPPGTQRINQSGNNDLKEKDVNLDSGWWETVQSLAHYYHRGGYVLKRVCFVCWLVCWSGGFHKNCRIELHKTWMEDGSFFKTVFFPIFFLISFQGTIRINVI